MGRVSVSVRIDAPPANVWAVLEDFGGIASWNPTLAGSRLLDTPNGGVGAKRHCDIKGSDGPRGFVRERVTEWKAGEGYAWEVYETDTPMALANNRFSIAPEGQGSVATFSLDYAMKGGPLGKLMEILMANRMMTKAAQATLHGLKVRSEKPAQVSSKAP